MTPKEIFKKYYSIDNKYFDYEYFTSITKHDPTTIIKEKELKKIGIYTKWIVKTQYGFLFKNYDNTKDYSEKLQYAFEDLEKIREYLTIFHKHKHKLEILKRDINKYSFYNRLYLEIKQFIITDNKNRNIFDLIEEKVDYEYIGVFNRFNCYVPLNQKGASVLGHNTEWCTSYGKESLDPRHITKTSQFDTYNKDNLYILINTSNPLIKYQLYFPTKMYMDRFDYPMKSVDKFYGLIIHLITNNKLKIKINDITNNKKYFDIYTKELLKTLKNINDLQSYMNIYLKFSDFNANILSDSHFMGLFINSDFIDIFDNMILKLTDNPKALVLIIRNLTPEHAKSVTIKHKKKIFSLKIHILTYIFGKFLNSNNIDIKEGLDLNETNVIRKGFRGMNLNKFI